jgi:hypothetical protein
MNRVPSRFQSYLLMFGVVVAAFTFASGCGGSLGTSGSSESGSSSSPNVQPIAVNAGPDGNYFDGAFTSVTVCSPGSTGNCQTISGILVDTGSSGLRILSSALTISLPQQSDTNNNPVAECAVFADGITWGAVDTADVKIAGEQASALPIQIVGLSKFPTVPTDCSSQGQPLETLADLGANGLLGIGPAIQDCGPDCTISGALSTGSYYSCPTAGCTDTTESMAQQVQNPVASFSTDNNGVVVEFPAVTAPQATLSGSLIFGIGTRSNNSLGGATVFGTDQYGDFNTVYNSVSHQSYLDSGSNALYFLDAATAGMPVCADLNFLYCPATAQNFSVQMEAQPGTNGASRPLSFTISNADTLAGTLGGTAINNLGGPNPGQFDFGLPFFFGRSVFTAIDGRSTPGGTGPYFAY